ncbi:MAG: ATP-binding cassette domain-containing protein [Planctomycetes bacterium]|nr:ATP-binding cassette domain-containing protein [Planctomycetota bacterium]
MIEVEHLTKRYGDVLAVKDVSFRVGEGEVVGFLGPNGAGKTTTLRILTAFLPATQGAVRVAGRDVLSRSVEVRAQLGYLPESVPLYPEMRVEEYLRFRAALKGVLRRDARARVLSALERCGCLDVRRRMIGKLSKGYRQRVGLADAIVHDPPILILDEPTSGLDPNQRIEVRRLIASLGENKTVLLSSHIIPEVEAVAERVIIIRRGEVVADGAPGQLLKGAGVGRRVRVELKGEAAAGALARLPGARSVERFELGEGWLRCEIEFSEPGDQRERVARAVLDAGAALRELCAPSSSLEDVFRSLTAADDEEPGGAR